MITKKVLIVDDELALLKALAEKMALESYSVVEARNGEEGLNTALKEHPDMILLDIIMPKMDGLTMLKKLREDAWGKTAKVILLTNLNSNEKLAEAIEEGSFQYLVKSDWKMEDLVKKVREQLDK